MSQWLEITLVAAQEILLLALDDGAHGVEQGLLALFEHLDEHAGPLVGILNLFFLLVLLDAQVAGFFIAVIHQGIALADLQRGNVVAQGDCQTSSVFVQLDIKVGCHLLGDIRAGTVCAARVRIKATPDLAFEHILELCSVNT